MRVASVSGRPLTPRRVASLDQHIAVINEYANGIIAERKEELASNRATFDAREDILSRFMALGESNVVELRDAVINFILAGRDTTAQTLTWLTYFLACSPHLQDELLAEIQEHCADEITLDSLKKLSLCQAAMDETLRLRPPVPIDIKTAVGDE